MSLSLISHSDSSIDTASNHSPGRLKAMRKRNLLIDPCGLESCSGQGYKGEDTCQASSFRAVPDPRGGKKINGVLVDEKVNRGSCPFYVCTKGLTKTAIDTILKTITGKLQNRNLFVIANSFTSEQNDETTEELASMIVFINKKIRGLLLFPSAKQNQNQVYIPQQIDHLRYWRSWRKSSYFKTKCDQPLTEEEWQVWQEWQTDLKDNYDQIIEETMTELGAVDWFPADSSYVSDQINQGYEENYGIPVDCKDIIDYWNKYIRFYVWDLILEGKVKIFTKTMENKERILNQITQKRKEDARPKFYNLENVYGQVTHDWV
jgi:hypothetical protein